MVLIEILESLNKQSTDDSPVSFTQLLILEAIDDFLDLPKDNKAHGWVLRLHHVHHIEVIVGVAVPRRRTGLYHVFTLEA